MHTNFDHLAAQRMEEHEGFARRSRLERVAREARGPRASTTGHGGWAMAHLPLIAASLCVSVGAAAIVVFGG
jgi:hypothetical protein